jgi:hypothetical protein
MQPIVTDIVAVFGLIGLPAAIAVGASLYIIHLAHDTISEKIKGAIKTEYDERLEILKSRLKAESDLELERNKHSLALEATRQNLRFARLHEMRATVIADVYAALNDTYLALKIYTAAFEPAGFPSKGERLKILSTEHQRFRKSLYPNRIYFPADVAKQLEEIDKKIFSSGNKFMWTVQLQGEAANQTNAWLDVLKDVDGPISMALQKLETEFRNLLGDGP